MEHTGRNATLSTTNAARTVMQLNQVSATGNGSAGCTRAGRSNQAACCDYDDGGCTGDSRQPINKCTFSADASKQARWEPAIMKLALSKDYLGRNVLGAG